MDKIDHQIVNLLIKDAQTPFSAIAKQIGVGKDTVSRRYAKLKKEGIIQKSSVIIDLQKCGFNGVIDFLVKVQPGADPDIVFDLFAKTPNVIVVARTLGDYDLTALCIFSDAKDLSNLKKAITAIEGVRFFDVCMNPEIVNQNQMEYFPAFSYYSKAIGE